MVVSNLRLDQFLLLADMVSFIGRKSPIFPKFPIYP
jgi:hypothetical protein